MFRKIPWALLAVVAAALIATCDGAFAQQQYDAGGKARVSIYCTTTTPGDTKCPPLGASGDTIQAQPYAAPSTNLSSTVTVGNTFQQIAASSTARFSFEFQNDAGNGDKCWLYWGTTGSATKAKSVIVLDGQVYLRSAGAIPSDAIQVTCTTTADAYYAETQ